MRRTSPSRKRSCGALLLLLLLAACRSESSGQAEEGEPQGDLVVLAAASLTDVFAAIELDFELKHPQVDLKLSIAGSQSLRAQIQNGIAAEVFASANQEHMTALHEQGLVDAPIVFAQNELVIVVPTSNPAGIQSLIDLPKAKRLVLAGEAVPAGLYSRKILESAEQEYGSDFGAGVQQAIVSRETHVRQVLQKVVLGEADAGLVYATDAASAGDTVLTIAMPKEHRATVTYVIATLSGSKRAHLGELFLPYLLSQAGERRLREYGFERE